MHVLMVKDEKEGGFKGAKKEGVVRFCENTLRHYWPNWPTPMNDSHMNICECDTCIVTDDLHRAYKAKRMKLLSGAYSTLKQMDDGTDKSQFEKEIDEYKNEVLLMVG